MMVNKKHGKQNRKKVWNLQKAFSLCTIKVCRFEIIKGVKYVNCIKHAYKFLLREQVGCAAVLWHLHQCVSCHITVTSILCIPVVIKFFNNQYFDIHISKGFN